MTNNDSIETKNSDQQQHSNVSSHILTELQNLNSRIATVEEKVQTNAQKCSNVIPQVYNAPVTKHQVAAEASNIRSRHSSSGDSSIQSKSILVPLLNSLQTSQRIQAYYYYVFRLSAISPYTTGLKALFNQSDCTGTAQTHK